MNNDNIELIIKQCNRLSKLLKNRLKISSRLYNRLIESQSILVNNEICSDDMYLNPDDFIEIIFKEENNEYNAQEYDLDIIFENEDILVINKQAGVVMHPTKNVLNNTLANYVSYHFSKIGLKRKVRFVNRIDRDTSGLVIVAKSSYAHQYIDQQQDIVKKYLAVVKGNLIKKSGTINKGILKEDIKYIISDKGKESITKYKVLEEYNNYSIIECQILTGRTHQIRVHLSDLGHPIVGDHLYGSKDLNIERQALHASYLKLKLPRSGKVIQLNSDLPWDIKKILK